MGNAKHALRASNQVQKKIILRVLEEDYEGAAGVRIEVTDNGVGIPPENLTRIFNHGFTTKKEGHGFGLHASANSVHQLGGSLKVHSEGSGCGATFIVKLPLKAVFSGV
jgi:signal transduction histidine kinase